MPGDQQIAGTMAWIEFATGQTAAALKHSQSALAIQPNDRTNRVSVNQGHLETHQYEKVIDDNWSNFHLWALFNLGRNEEANTEARKVAERGDVGSLFAFLNATNQSATVVEHFHSRWDSLSAFQQDVPPNGLFGYGAMAQLAYAFSRSGDQSRFDEAMAILGKESQSTYDQGIRSGASLLVKAAYHVMNGEQGEALRWIGEAIDGGLVVSKRISHEYPYFEELEGHPEYEAIQARMIEHLNRERTQLGLEPVEA
jgi:tetratricopeptide (TPR) repeat protein